MLTCPEMGLIPVRAWYLDTNQAVKTQSVQYCVQRLQLVIESFLLVDHAVFNLLPLTHLSGGRWR